MGRRAETRGSMRKGSVERIADIEDHPFQPKCAPQQSIADVGALKKVQENLVGVWQAAQERFVDRSTGDGDPFDDRVGRPVRSSSGVRGRGAVEVKSDGAWIPGESIIVVVQAVPTRVERRAITAQWGRRCTELGALVVLDHRESGPFSKLPGLVDIPIARSRPCVGEPIDSAVLQVETTLAPKTVSF